MKTGPRAPKRRPELGLDRSDARLGSARRLFPYGLTALVADCPVSGPRDWCSIGSHCERVILVFPSNDPIETVPESERTASLRGSRASEPVLGFIVLWSADEPLFLGVCCPSRSTPSGSRASSAGDWRKAATQRSV
jgi:hypothetical protein